jgi:hypothetical protein
MEGRYGEKGGVTRSRQSDKEGVMPGLVPGIHVLLPENPKTWMAPEVGLARLPLTTNCRKSGEPDLR